MRAAQPFLRFVEPVYYQVISVLKKDVSTGNVFTVLYYFCVFCAFAFVLSVPVQVIAWKVERLVSEMTFIINFTHSLTHSRIWKG